MKTVKIGKNDYVMVSERVKEIHKLEKALSITTEISYEGSYIRCKATVTTSKGVFVGHAEEERGSKDMGGQKPVEISETSAIGRALGFAGVLVTDSIASADEVINNVDKPVDKPVSKPALSDKSPEYKIKEPNAPMSLPQQRKIRALEKEKGVDHSLVKAYIMEKYSLESSTGLTKGQASELIGGMMKGTIKFKAIEEANEELNSELPF